MSRIFYDFSNEQLEYTNSKWTNVLKIRYKLSYRKCNAYKEYENPVFKKIDCCALHCQDEEVESKDIDDYLTEFFDLFVEYLIKKIKSDRFYTLSKSGSNLTDYPECEFKHRNIIFNNELKERVGGISILVENIIFPKVSDLEGFILNTKTIIRYLGKVYFEKCRFGYLYFNGHNNCYHKECVFSENLEIHPFPQIKNKENENSIEYRYIDCIFEKNISLLPSIFTDKMHCNMFYHCLFKRDISISNLKFKKTLFEFPDILQVIKNKKAVDVNFNSRKYFNRIKSCYKIKNLSIIHYRL